VFLKLKAKRSLIILGNFLKLAARYYGYFEILEKIGPVAYMLALPASIRMHKVFHVSLLKMYVPDLDHIIHWNVIQLAHEGDFQVEPIRILDRKVKVLRNKSIGMIKFQWTF
jgi:hypothetical protein